MNNVAMVVEKMPTASTQQARTSSKTPAAPFEIPTDLTEADQSQPKPPTEDIDIDTPRAIHEPKADNITPDKAKNPQQQNKPQVGNETTPTDKTPPQPQQTPHEKGPDDDKLSSIPAQQPAVVQLWLDQYAANTEHGNNGIAAMCQPKAGQELAQMLVALKTSTLTPIAADPALKPQPDQPLSAAQTQQLFVKIDIDATEESALLDFNSALKPQQTNLDTQQTTQGLVQSATQPNPGQTPLQQDNPAENPPQACPRLINLTPESASQAVKLLTTAQTPAEPPMQHNPAGAKLNFPSLAAENTSKNDSTPAPAQTSAEQPMTKILYEITTASAQPYSNLTPDAAAALAAQLRAQLTAAKTQPLSPDQKDTKTAVESILTQVVSNRYSDTLTTSAQVAKPAPEAPQPGAFSDVARQVFESIQTSLPRPLANQQLTIRLNPPDLGRVSVHFQENSDSLTGILNVTRPETKREIERALPLLIRNLENAGIHIKRLEVLLTDQAGQQPHKDQSFSDSFFHQQGLAEKQHLTKPALHSWQPDPDFSASETEPQFLAAGKSINILI